MNRFDTSPPNDFADLFATLPDYSPIKDNFWFDWGPIFYKGRLDGTAKILCVASDPGPTERIAGRTLVGNAGQRVQGFLNKVGLTKSYVCVNGFVYALFPGSLSKGIKALERPDQTAFRNALFDKLKSPNLQAVVAFGEVAKKAVKLWNTKGDIPVFETYHPSYHATGAGAEKKMLTDWNRVVTALRQIVTPDSNGQTNLPLYDDVFTESDYASIPRYDLPFGVPDWLGNDAWFRQNTHKMNSVNRPSPDDRHTLVWNAPKLN
jgi:uracil-DNA glycosylase